MRIGPGSCAGSEPDGVESFRRPSSNRDEGCLPSLTLSRSFFDSAPKLLRRRDDSGTCGFGNPLFPAADGAATGPARPFLDTRVHRLRVERVAMTVRELRTRRALGLL